MKKMFWLIDTVIAYLTFFAVSMTDYHWFRRWHGGRWNCIRVKHPVAFDYMIFWRPASEKVSKNEEIIKAEERYWLSADWVHSTFETNDFLKTFCYEIISAPKKGAWEIAVNEARGLAGDSFCLDHYGTVETRMDKFPFKGVNHGKKCVLFDIEYSI